jgi:hypothetical protein
MGRSFRILHGKGKIRFSFGDWKLVVKFEGSGNCCSVHNHDPDIKNLNILMAQKETFQASKKGNKETRK